MDKVLSARVDEAVLHRLGVLADAMGTTKKDVLERAILAFAEQVEGKAPADVIRETSGAWVRGEGPEATVARGRDVFRRSMQRHRR